MRKSIRLSLLAAGAVAALALAGSAFAATFKPDLWASNFDPLIGVQSLEIAGSPSDVATAKATIYMGKGDVMSVPGGAVGANIGGVVAVAKLGPAFGNAVVTLTGSVVVAKASDYVSNPCAAGNHEAVWLLALNTPTGGKLRIPVYVDTAQPPASGFASYQAQTCLPSPYIPEDQGGAPFGAQVRRVAVSLFNFESAVPNRWTAILTPYVEGTGTPNPLGTVETQSIVSQAKIAKLKAKRVSKGKKHKRYWAKTSGVVKENGHGTAAKVKLYAVGKKKLKLVAQRKSKASGKFSFKKRLKKTTRFVVEAFKPDGHVNPPQCVPDLDLGFGALPCTSVSTSGFDTIKVTRILKVPKKH